MFTAFWDISLNWRLLALLSQSWEIYFSRRRPYVVPATSSTSREFAVVLSLALSQGLHCSILKVFYQKHIMQNTDQSLKLSLCLHESSQDLVLLPLFRITVLFFLLCCNFYLRCIWSVPHSSHEQEPPTHSLLPFPLFLSLYICESFLELHYTHIVYHVIHWIFSRSFFTLIWRVFRVYPAWFFSIVYY